MPPMTTVAKGRWTSAPVPAAIAIGTKPSDATSAVIMTGRSRVSDPCAIASSSDAPALRKWLINVTITAVPDPLLELGQLGLQLAELLLVLLPLHRRHRLVPRLRVLSC